MAATAAYILAGISGGGTAGTSLAYFAPTGSTAPTTATAAPAAAFLDAGWCDTTGLIYRTSETTREVFAFGTTSPVRTLVTNSISTFDIDFLESNTTSVNIYHRRPLIGTTVTAGAFDFATGASVDTHYAAVFDMVDGANHLRAYCPDVEVTGRNDLTVAAGEPIKYGVTLTAHPGTDGTAIHWFYVVTGLT